MTHDNIFESDCDAIVNPINCVGVMGGGLAKQFRQRYPEMNLAYQHACARGAVKVGRMWTWFHTGQNLTDPSRWIINFPTKDDWRNPSTYGYIEEGLKNLLLVVEDLHLTSIAIPALGCGLGGLPWDRVEDLIMYYMRSLPRTFRTEIYPPNGRKYDL